MITTTLCAKPHVAAFIQHKFRRELTDTTVAKIPKNATALYNAIGHYCTVHFPDRLITAPGGMILFKAALPRPYERYFLSQAGAADFGKSMEDYFWKEFQLYMLLHISEYNIYKDHLIKTFMSEHGITESIYPLDHFRRQCTRMNIRGLRDPIPLIQTRIYRGVPDHICMQMYRIYRDRQISAKVIGDHYGLHRRKVERIIQKINNTRMSKTVAKTDAQNRAA